MLLNDTRGSLGMFSRAGRNSSEKYHIISRKEEILSGGRRKIKIKNIFTPDSNPKQYEALDDQIDIFKIDIADNQDNHNKNNFTNKSTEQINYKPIKTSKSQIIGRKQVKVKRSSMNIKKKKTSSPSCTKYNPKNEYIWKRVLTGPEWTKVTGRKDYIKPVTEGDYFMTQTDFKVTGKTFINFAKQTHRKGFSKIYNSSTCNKTVSSDKRLATEPHLISQEMDTSIINIHIDYPDNDISIHQIPNKTVHSSDNHDLGTAKTTKNKNSLLKSYPSLFSNTTTSKWRQNNAPDFKKVISREQLNKIYGDKRSVIPFSMPDDKSTRESNLLIYFRNNYDGQV